MACPIPDCALSGATTTTSPNVFITSINAAIPGDVMPSSLVTNISGFSFFIKAKILIINRTELNEFKYDSQLIVDKKNYHFLSMIKKTMRKSASLRGTFCVEADTQSQKKSI
jgi:hypothetical protein